MVTSRRRARQSSSGDRSSLLLYKLLLSRYKQVTSVQVIIIPAFIVVLPEFIVENRVPGSINRAGTSSSRNWSTVQPRVTKCDPVICSAKTGRV
eukprot:COSAG02_NODE_2361_length_9063_cov_3.936859_10_plen_94_part_00